MTNSTLSEDIALRIGLAARSLPDTTPAQLLDLLADKIGLPFTAEKLERLTVKDLRAAQGDLAELDGGAWKGALAYLKGTAGADSIPPPIPEPPLTAADGSEPNGLIRVAFASNNGDLLDGHFGSCQRFLVYQVGADRSRLIDCRPVEITDEVDDKNGYRASLISDCQLLFVASIGGPAAAKVVKQDIHPIKVAEGGSVSSQIAELQQVIASKTPPWLAKIMGQAPESRVRFEARAAEA